MIVSPRVVTIAPAPTIAHHIVIDIETIDAGEDAILATQEAWQAPSNWKPETAAAKRAEMVERLRDKAALLDASPIVCIGARSDREAVMFSGGGGADTRIDGWHVIGTDNERDMLQAFSVWLGTCADLSTTWVGHNVRGFDLPKIRNAFVRHRLALPESLRPREGAGNPVADTMHLFRHFSMEHRDDRFVGLDTVAAAFGVPKPKAVVSGAEVPRLYREGRIAEILTYNAIDIDTTAEIYRLMTA